MTAREARPGVADLLVAVAVLLLTVAVWHIDTRLDALEAATAPAPETRAPILVPASLSVAEAAAPARVAVSSLESEEVLHAARWVTPSTGASDAEVGAARSSAVPTSGPTARATPHLLQAPEPHQLTRDEVYEIALAVSGSTTWASDATRISYCESRWQPAAVGAAGEEGLMQVRAIYHGPVPADPEGQLAQAYAVWQAQGWLPWSCAR